MIILPIVGILLAGLAVGIVATSLLAPRFRERSSRLLGRVGSYGFAQRAETKSEGGIGFNLFFTAGFDDGFNVRREIARQVNNNVAGTRGEL